MNDSMDLSIRQIIEAWRLMCSGSPGRTVEAADGVDYSFSGCPIAFFNVALLTERGISGGALKSRAERACAWASSKGVPWLFIVTHEALDAGTDAVSILDECGLDPMMPMTGMLAQHVAPLASVADGLHLTVPQDDSGCSAILVSTPFIANIFLPGFWSDMSKLRPTRIFLSYATRLRCLMPGSATCLAGLIRVKAGTAGNVLAEHIAIFDQQCEKVMLHSLAMQWQNLTHSLLMVYPIIRPGVNLLIYWISDGVWSRVSENVILDASQAITVDETFYLMSALSGAVRDYVSDNEILRKIQARFTELMRRQDLPGAEWRNEP